ncbi:non-homologous end joining protein Ku [Paractinoplanes lichenicola]|uniref:Non-homologous end joining protein Ku n=1 Tax=Paractinoplanes lichenicola TaxID=2802976 RepID=A0ABS1VUH8_9ACTN|nr:Ku protein [Actinoplanes lichenicola]MBL7258146.1 Ku protein [Actinoplanes lichenicola]
MARPIWTGAITFGLVSVPVAMYSATHDHEVGFHQFEKGTSDRIRYRRVNERTGKEVDYDNIVKGAEVGDGDYVMLEQDELDSVAPGRSKSLDIHRFVELAEIDPLYYQKTYWLGPGSDETAKVYGLLRDAMADTGRAAVGTLVMRGKEYLTAIRAEKKLLVLQTMYFADEVRDPDEQIDSLPQRNKAKPAEMHMAQQLIDSMSGPWKPADYRDSYTDRVKDLVKAKSKGKKVKTAEPAPDPTAASDLFEILRKSVEAASKRRASAPTSTSKKKKPDVSEMSKAELLKLARKLDVPGRSSMSRPELEKAVRKAA